MPETTDKIRHTPGPWKATTYPAGRSNDKLSTGSDVVAEARGVHIATVGPLGCDAHDTRMANASLIAVAPALLAALIDSERALGEAREMLGVFEDNGGHDGLRGEGYRACIDHMDDARSANRAALAKVEGR